MRAQILRLACALLAVSFAAPLAPAEAEVDGCGCPSHLENGTIACHNTAGSWCGNCTYNCGAAGTYKWCVCHLLSNCGSCGTEPCEDPEDPECGCPRP